MTGGSRGEVLREASVTAGEHLLWDLLRREEGGERKRLKERERFEQDNERPPATRGRTRSPPSLSGETKPLRSSSRKNFLIRLD